jgi:hypothetical protein
MMSLTIRAVNLAKPVNLTPVPQLFSADQVGPPLLVAHRPGSTGRFCRIDRSCGGIGGRILVRPAEHNSEFQAASVRARVAVSVQTAVLARVQTPCMAQPGAASQLGLASEGRGSWLLNRSIQDVPYILRTACKEQPSPVMQRKNARISVIGSRTA